MMSYPWKRWPLYEDFLAQLTSLGVKIKTADGTLVDPEGIEHAVQYLESEVDGATYYYPTSFSAEGEIISPKVMRTVISALKLDPAHFGLHLDAMP